MGASQMAVDAMVYVGQISPLLLVLGGVAFGDLLIFYMIKLVKAGKIKW